MRPSAGCLPARAVVSRERYPPPPPYASHVSARPPRRGTWYPRHVSAAAEEEAVLASAGIGEGAARPDVSVVVTGFNEARNIDELIERLERALVAWGRPWEVLLVDDGSSDRSRALLRAAHARDRRFRVV